MTASVRQFIESFDRLPEAERREVVAEILRRARHMELPPLGDEELSLAAEALFLELDEGEAADGRS